MRRYERSFRVGWVGLGWVWLVGWGGGESSQEKERGGVRGPTGACRRKIFSLSQIQKQNNLLTPIRSADSGLGGKENVPAISAAKNLSKGPSRPSTAAGKAPEAAAPASSAACDTADRAARPSPAAKEGSTAAASASKAAAAMALRAAWSCSSAPAERAASSASEDRARAGGHAGRREGGSTDWARR